MTRMIIGGNPTRVELPKSIANPQPRKEVIGDVTVLHFGNYKKVIGVATVETTTHNSELNIVEGSLQVTLPIKLHDVVDFNVVVMDNSTGSLMEHAHIGDISGKQFTVYTSCLGQTHKEIKVKWAVEGFI